MDKNPLIFHELSDDDINYMLNEGPFNTPKKMFANVNSAYKSGLQIGHEIAMHFESYMDKRPASTHILVQQFKIGLYSGLCLGFQEYHQKENAKLMSKGK